ncbi:MAG: GIY-YIG nuclease family protein [Balneolaceae bacterium]|nr:GIY-YIG nuclease family protein [Balneolaceae bacterium]
MITEYFVYILSNASGMLYVGLTTDLPSMLQKHRTQNVQSFKANFAFYKVEYVKHFTDPKEAVCQFHALKGMNMREKRELIAASENPEVIERDLGIKQIA